MADFDPIASGQAIGQGMAQVFGPFEDKYSVKAAEMQVKGAEAAAKKAEKTQADLLEKIGKAKAIDILAGDQPEFAGWQKEIYDWTKENIDKLNKGDVGTTLEFNNKLNEFALKAAHSKDYREKIQQLGQTLVTNQDQFEPEAMDTWLKQASKSFDEKGNFREVDITQYKKKEEPFDVNDFYNKSFNTYKPFTETTVTPIPGGGSKTVVNQYYKDPAAVATNMLTSPQYFKFVSEKVAKLKPEEQEALKTKSVKRVGEENPILEWSIQDFEKLYPQKETDATRYRAPRAASGAGGKKIELLSPGQANITMWQRIYGQTTGEQKPAKQSPALAYQVPFSGDLNIQLAASRFYNPNEKYYKPDGTEDATKVGTWIPQNINEKINFGSIQYIPATIDNTGRERFLNAEEAKTGIITGTNRKITKPFMKSNMESNTSRFIKFWSIYSRLGKNRRRRKSCSKSGSRKNKRFNKFKRR